VHTLINHCEPNDCNLFRRVNLILTGHSVHTNAHKYVLSMKPTIHIKTRNHQQIIIISQGKKIKRVKKPSTQWWQIP